MEKEAKLAEETKVEEKEPMHTVREKTIEVEYAEITQGQHPTMQAISKFCSLYIGVDENFEMLSLNEALVKVQEKFQKVSERLYVEVFEKPMPRPGMPEPDRSKMTDEEKQVLQDKNVEFGIKFTDFSSKKVELKYYEINIPKQALKNAMAREEKKIADGKAGILMNPNDMAVVTKFVNFV